MRISDWSSDVCSSDLFGVDCKFWLIHTVPVSSRLATSSALSTSADHTAPARPYSLALARATTSTIDLKRSSGRTGPHDSATTTREPSGGLSTRVRETGRASRRVGVGQVGAVMVGG